MIKKRVTNTQILEVVMDLRDMTSEQFTVVRQEVREIKDHLGRIETIVVHDHEKRISVLEDKAGIGR